MLNKDFKEFIKLLNKNKVEYLLIGGYAVAFHGYPRYTKDIDFVINNDENNAKRIIKVRYYYKLRANFFRTKKSSK